MLRQVIPRSPARSPALIRKSRFSDFLPLLSGFLYVLCFPGWNLGFLAWAAFVPLLAALPYKRHLRAFLLAGAAGFLANLGTLYWIYPTCRAAQVDIPTSLAAVVSLALYMSLYWAAFGLLVRRLEERPLAGAPFLLAAAWTALEWVRAHALTGFPWLPLAESQWQAPPVLAAARWGGGYLISFFIMLANATLARLLRDRMDRRWDWGRRLMAPSAALALGAGVSVYLWRTPPAAAGPPVKVAVAQGNIDQYKKWDQAYEDEIVQVYGGLTREAAAAGAELIVWPETAVPGWVPNESKYVDWLKVRARESGAFLLVGAASHQQGLDYNAAFLLSPLGDILGQYRKRHLVPFGEIIPFQPLLSRWIRVLGELGDFASSDDWTVFRIPGAAFSANICFESLFPDIVAGFVKRGARMTVNMSNDGWFLDTAAPEQHFAASVLRAVETGTWVVHAANTGISGFIDPQGRVVARGPMNRRTLVRGEPAPAAGTTFYVRRGDLFALACLAAALLAALWPALARARFRRLDSVPTER